MHKMIAKLFRRPEVQTPPFDIEKTVSWFIYSGHARYLLSKFGGIRFDKGFQPDDALRDVAAIDIGMHETLCKMYLDGEHGFKILYENVFQG